MYFSHNLKNVPQKADDRKGRTIFNGYQKVLILYLRTLGKKK